MLARYRMYRGARPGDDPLPEGVRKDTRKHTRHFLRPPADAVERYLASPSEAAWSDFAARYRDELQQRLRDDPMPFDALAEQARREDVYLGCSCPTAANPDVRHCHTWLALEFFAARYPDLEVVFPAH